MKMAKKTVAGLSKRYVILEKRHESPNFMYGHALSQRGQSVMFAENFKDIRSLIIIVFESRLLVPK